MQIFEVNRNILDPSRDQVYVFSDFSKLLNPRKGDLNTCMLVNTTLYVFTVFIRKFIAIQNALILQGSASGVNCMIEKLSLNSDSKTTT